MTATPDLASSPAIFPVLSHLPSLGVDFAATAAILAVSAVLGLTRGSGHRRPRLPLDTRVRRRMWPGPGFARSRWLLWRRYGLPAARRIARHGRPSLSRRAIRFGPWQEYATFVGWAHGWLFPPRIYSHLEQIRLVIAPPQKGKSAAAAGNIIDDRGPVVATSIRGDLIAATAGIRSRMGKILIFNPEGAGRFRSTITWNLVAGCQDMATAARRAGYLIEGAAARGLEEASFWQDQAAMVLAAYLHAAGLAQGNMQHVYRWILDEDEQPLRILAAHPGAAPEALRLARRYLALPDRTRAGVSTILYAALRFMQDPQIASMLCPPGPGSLDIARFIRSRDTLYLVVSDAKQSPVPPVFTALIAEIAWTVRIAGGAAGRLDPPVYFELDEIANTAPVPVAAWATWAAGSGIRMSIYAQSYAQLAERYGEHGAETIWQACDAKFIYTGTSEDGLCRRVEQACGPVRLRGPDNVTWDPGGKQRRTPTWSSEPVMPAARVLQLPPGRAIFIQGGSPPLVVRTERYWKRADVRRDPLAAAPPLPAAAPRRAPEPRPHLLRPPARPPAQPPARPAAGPAAWPADELAARRQSRHASAPPPGAVRRHPRPDPRDTAPWPDIPAEGDFHEQ